MGPAGSRVPTRPGSLPVAGALAAGREEHQAVPASRGQHSSAFREASPGHSETHCVLTGTRHQGKARESLSPLPLRGAATSAPTESLGTHPSWPGTGDPTVTVAYSAHHPDGLAGLSCPPCVHPRTPSWASPGVACSFESTKQTIREDANTKHRDGIWAAQAHAEPRQQAGPWSPWRPRPSFQLLPSSPATSLKIQATTKSRRWHAGSQGHSKCRPPRGHRHKPSPAS